MVISKYQQLFKCHSPFKLTLGGQLPYFQIAYETWGALNREKTNAILLFTGLSGHSHAKSHGRDDTPGWWEAMLGPGEALDTARFFVICVNHLGGCFGSTGPSSTNPETGTYYGPDFPPLMIIDLVNAVKMVVDAFGIERLYCVMGPSMGGMLALEYAARYPRAVRNLLMISGTGRPGAQGIAYRYLQRQIILNDPAYEGGRYYDKEEQPTKSMAVARQVGNLTYRSRWEMNARFGRRRTTNGYNFGPDFEVESYLHHMGRKLASQFDANSFMFLTKAMDLFSLGYGFPTYREGVARIKARTLIMGVSTDMLFPIEEQESVYRILKQEGVDAGMAKLESWSGHDAFLVEVDYFRKHIGAFLKES